MISYVIPTLWKSNNIYTTIDQFTKQINDPKSELIIIDNSNSSYKNEDERVKILKMENNIYVNPAWDLGVKFSSNDKVCLINDDILFNLPKFHTFITSNDIVTVGMNNVNHIPKDKDKWSLIEVSDKNARPAGMGQLMLFKKENWLSLPYKMKLWHGDDIIYYYHTLILNIPFNYIEGMSVGGEQSTSINLMSTNMKEPFGQDSLEYYKLMHILGIDYCTVFPMELKRAWKYGDIESKLRFELLLNKIINE